MYVNGVQCDACTKMHNMDIIREEIPKGWIVLVEPGVVVNSKGDERRHFCSIHCLHDWVEKQMPVVEEVDVDPVVMSQEDYERQFKKEHGRNFGERKS